MNAIHPKEKSLSSLIKEADIVFGNWIKARDTKDGVIRCFICGNIVPRNQAQVMHFIDRDQMAVRFDEMNVHAGCKTCNCFDTDHKLKYTVTMISQYGREEVAQLFMKSKSLAKMMRFEIGSIIETYREKLKQLR